MYKHILVPLDGSTLAGFERDPTISTVQFIGTGSWGCPLRKPRGSQTEEENG